MNKIGEINVLNKYTFTKLNEVLKNKRPTNKTILLLRLYAEKQISAQEMLILKKEDLVTKKIGKDLIKKQDCSKSIYIKIQNLDNHKTGRKRMSEKLGL